VASFSKFQVKTPIHTSLGYDRSEVYDMFLCNSGFYVTRVKKLVFDGFFDISQKCDIFLSYSEIFELHIRQNESLLYRPSRKQCHSSFLLQRGPSTYSFCQEVSPIGEVPIKHPCRQQVSGCRCAGRWGPSRLLNRSSSQPSLSDAESNDALTRLCMVALPFTRRL
jgi:hypothetical protein